MVVWWWLLKSWIRSSPVQCIMESGTNVQRTLRAMVLTLCICICICGTKVGNKFDSLENKSTAATNCLFKRPYTFDPQVLIHCLLSQIFDVQVSIHFLQIFGVQVSIHICLHKYSKMPDAGNKEQWS